MSGIKQSCSVMQQNETEDQSPAFTTTYVALTSPPTPSPSPRPSKSRCTESKRSIDGTGSAESAALRDVRLQFHTLDVRTRNQFLADVLASCSAETLLYVSNLIMPRLKRDFLHDLPTEIALHIISFITEPCTLTRAATVSKRWNALLCDEVTWRTMCRRHKYCVDRAPGTGNDGLCCSPRARVVRRLSITDAEEQARRLAATSAVSTAQDDGMELDTGDNDSSILEDDALVENMRQLSVPDGASSPSHMPNLPTQMPNKGKGRGRSRRGKSGESPLLLSTPFSFRQHFKASYLTEGNWRRGGQVQRSHTFDEGGTVTSVSIDSEWILVSLTNLKVHVFSAATGALVRSLQGHTQGMWALHLVSRGGKPIQPPSTPSTEKEDPWLATSTTPVTTPGLYSYASSPFSSPRPQAGGHLQHSTLGISSASPYFAPSTSAPTLLGVSTLSSTSSVSSSLRRNTPPASPRVSYKQGGKTPLPPGLNSRQSDVCNASYGWGQEGALAVTGSCDRDLRVWDVRSGYCLHVLRGHGSTVRCVKALDGRPIAISGARDGVVRIWDIQKGICLRVLTGHTNSVRALDVAGNIAVTGSYDHTSRLWNVDTGECMRVFRGHTHQIYSVAFDGVRVATGSLDSTVRLWDAESGDCLSLLQGHTSLVGNLQILDDDLVTGGSDGRVIVFDLSTYATRLRICAHDNSVTTMQVDTAYLITGGNDGCVKLFDRENGALVRELTERCEGVWKVVMRRDKCVIMCKRGGKTVVEVLSFAPTPEQR